MDKKTILELKNISRTLKEDSLEVTLVKDINLTFYTDEFVSITGPSGSGKSSLLYLIGLLDQPSSGQIILETINTTTATAEQKEKIRLEKLGFVFQFHFLLPEFTALENVMLPMRKLGKMPFKDMQERARYLLDSFDLKEAYDKKPGQLSGGQRQRVAIARAMANNPPLILADEPTGNLDTKNSDLVFSIFQRLAREEKKTVIVITHNPAFADLTDRQIKIVDGRISHEV